MKKYAMLMGLFVALFIGNQVHAEEPSIRVLLAKEARGILFEARGGYRVVNRVNQKYLSSGEAGKRFVAHAMTNGLRWGEEYPGIYAISVLPTNEKTTFYVDGMQYKGPIHVYCTKKGLVNVVNEAPIEEFIRSTLSLKLTTPMQQEAAAALAIVARTNAFAKVCGRKDPNVLWDVHAKDMAYFGMGVTLHHPELEQAVDLTKHIVLEDRAGVPMQNVQISVGDAEKLAAKGLDAKRILRNAISQGEIGMINSPKGKKA